MIDAERWARHHDRLLPYVRFAYPDVDPEALAVAGDDFHALVVVLQSATGAARDVLVGQLAQLEVDPADLGPAPELEPEQEATPESGRLAALRLDGGFGEHERDLIEARLRPLERRLRVFPVDAVDLAIRVKDRGTNSQEVVLEAWLPRLPHLVATSTARPLPQAVSDAGADLRRQLNRTLERARAHQEREPTGGGLRPRARRGPGPPRG